MKSSDIINIHNSNWNLNEYKKEELWNETYGERLPLSVPKTDSLLGTATNP